MKLDRLPPFSAVLKSRDVEDPVNLWLHRPLAYGFVALVYRTAITPNHITLIALAVGLVAAACWYFGTPGLMLAGGILLWASAILDGADGILARARRQLGELGRAIDGTADAGVALATVSACVYHLWSTHHDLMQMLLVPFTVASALVHIELYDFYKESFMYRTDPGWNGQPERRAEVEARLPRLVRERAHWTSILATHVYIGLVRAQTRIVALTNPWGAREHLTYPVSAETVRIYRRHNLRPMHMWSTISLAPHSYMMAICGMFDRLDVYLWIRLVAANVVFVVLMIWQLVASRRTEQALAVAGLAPVPVHEAARAQAVLGRRAA